MSTYKIPQRANPEDKIIGPFTMRDILLLLVTALGCYFVFTLLPKNPVVEFSLEELLTVIGIMAFLGFVFIFIKPEERGLETWVVEFITFLTSPKIRLWQKEISLVSYDQQSVLQEEKKEQKESPLLSKKALQDNQTLATLSSLIDNPEKALLQNKDDTGLDILNDSDEIENIKKTISDEQSALQTEKTQKKQQKQSEEIITQLNNESSEAPRDANTSGSMVLVKPATGIKGLFSSITRGFSSVINNVTPAKKSAPSVELVTNIDNVNTLITKKNTPPQLSNTQEQTQSLVSENPNTPKIGSDVAASPEQLIAELQKLQKQQESKTKNALESGKMEHKQSVRIISEADPLA
ncbi:MAG: PrgI family protein [bacterium]